MAKASRKKKRGASMPATEIDFSRFKLRADVPPHRQVAAYLKAQIALGALGAGDAIPGVPAIAYRIRVAPVEVRRAYSELADRGYLASRGGKWRVSDDHQATSEDAAEGICEKMWDLIVEGRRAGLSRPELQRMFKLLISK